MASDRDIRADLIDLTKAKPGAGSARLALAFARVFARECVPSDAQLTHVIAIFDYLQKDQRDILQYVAPARLLIDARIDDKPLPCAALDRIAQSAALADYAGAARFALATVQTLGRIHARLLAAWLADNILGLGDARGGRALITRLHRAGVLAYAANEELCVGSGTPLARAVYELLRKDPALPVSKVSTTIGSRERDVTVALQYLERIEAIKRIPSLRDPRALHTLFNPHFEEVCRGSD